MASFGGEYQTLGVADGEVYITPPLTEQMIRAIRSFGPAGHGPDLVLLNRPSDYRRDHRYTAQLVLDAVYMLMVPFMCPETPELDRMPVLAYWFDSFNEGGPFRPDVVVPIDRVADAKARIVVEHESQLFEWLPPCRRPDAGPGRRGQGTIAMLASGLSGSGGGWPTGAGKRRPGSWVQTAGWPRPFRSASTATGRRPGTAEAVPGLTANHLIIAAVRGHAAGAAIGMADIAGLEPQRFGGGAGGPSVGRCPHC